MTHFCCLRDAYAPNGDIDNHVMHICVLQFQVKQSESILHVPEVDDSVGELVNGSLAHCLVASQWGTPATAEYAVMLSIVLCIGE